MKTALNSKTTALVLVDPQIDVLSPDGVMWDLVGEQVKERGIVAKLRQLRDGAEKAGVPVFYSHIQIPPADYDQWTPRSNLQGLMAERKMMLEGVGSRFLPELAPTAATNVCSPRRGPSPNGSDLAFQLRQRGLDTIVFAGMIANLCVESHVREATDQGFTSIVVGDAVATTDTASHDAALSNFGLLAADVVTTDDVLDAFGA